MAYGMEAGYVPGGFEATVSAPGPVVQGNEDILDFLRQMQFRQQRSQRLARRPGLSQRPTMAPPAAPAPASERDNSQASFVRQLQAIELQKAMQEANRGIWKQNGPYGMQNVSPGTPGAVLWQSGF